MFESFGCNRQYVTVPLAVDESPEPRVVLLPQVVEARPDEELVERVHALQHVHPVGLSGLNGIADMGILTHAPSSKQICSAEHLHG